MQFAFAVILDHPRIHKVTGDSSAGNAFAFDRMWCGTRLGHVEEMVVMLDAVEDRLPVQRVFEALLRARVEKGVFEIRGGIQFEGIRPQIWSSAPHLLRTFLPLVDVVNEIRRGPALPHEGDTIAFDDGVSGQAGELEEVGGHGGIVILASVKLALP